jgi:DNA-directed RNA polymerase specialized sigma24 family protein
MPHARLSRTQQDAIVLEIFALATRHAETLVPSSYRDDVVQDLVLECLKGLRYGVWDVPSEELDEYVENCLGNRRASHRRSRLRAMIRQLEYLGATGDAPREWMSQDHKLEEDRLRDFARQVRRTLPAKWVRAHAMVRDERMTYAEVARKLKTTAKCVHNYVTAVQNAFRQALPSIGIEPQKSARGGLRQPEAQTHRPAA